MLLTVKDFIIYNNPCFSCKEQVVLEVRTGDKKKHSVKRFAKLNPTVSLEIMEVDLVLRYSASLKLQIFLKTNKFKTSNLKALTQYLREHKLALVSHCIKCGSYIESSILEFDMQKGFIKPLSINFEKIRVTHDGKLFTLGSFDDKSTLIISNLSPGKDDVIIEMPLYPLSKFKDREHFVSKFKTYLLFS